MKAIFRVGFRARWTYHGRNEVPPEDSIKVLAKSAEAAIAKAKADYVGDEFEDENEPGKIHKCIRFELLSVECLAEADL